MSAPCFYFLGIIVNFYIYASCKRSSYLHLSPCSSTLSGHPSSSFSFKENGEMTVLEDKGWSIKLMIKTHDFLQHVTEAPPLTGLSTLGRIVQDLGRDPSVTGSAQLESRRCNSGCRFRSTFPGQGQGYPLTGIQMRRRKAVFTTALKQEWGTTIMMVTLDLQ